MRLRELAEVRGRAAIPDVEDREVRLAVLADLKRHLGRGRRVAGPERARAGRREVVQADPVQLLQEGGVLLAEREQRAAVAGIRARVELVGPLALKRADEEVAAPVA